MLLLTVVLGLAGGAIILVIKGTLASNKAKSSEFSALFKMIANHFQLLALILGFDLDWPPQVQGLLSVLQPVADVSQRILSLDCFLGRGVEGGAAACRLACSPNSSTNS